MSHIALFYVYISSYVMATTESKMIMTVRINQKVASTFTRLIKGIGLRRDTYLNKLLPGEVKLLQELPVNSERAAKYVRLTSQSGEEQKTRFSLKLDSALVDQVTDLCRRKGIPRDLFIERFLDFLVNGYENDGDLFDDVPAPLGKAYELITNPYWDADGELNIYEDLHYHDALFDTDLFKRLLGDTPSTKIERRGE